MYRVMIIVVAGLTLSLAASARADPHWSAAIGTGHVTSGERAPHAPVAQHLTAKAARSAPAPHWTAGIATGLAPKPPAAPCIAP